MTKLTKYTKHILFIVALLCSLAFIVQQGWLEHLTDGMWVQQYVKKHGAAGHFMLLLAMTVFTGLGWPRQIVSFISGFVFGAFAGAGFALLATVLGCLCSYVLAATVLRPLLAAKLSNPSEKIANWLSQHTFKKTLIIRLMPIGSNLLTNLLAGYFAIRLRPFVSGSALGYLPQTLVFSFAGAGIGFGESSQLLVSAVLFVVASILGVYLYRNTDQPVSLQGKL